MTQQFKFGDIVRHPDFKTECVFIRQWYDDETKEKTWAEVFNDDECENQTRLVTHEPLELVPHPDTARLDWFADVNQHIGHIMLPKECVYLNVHDMRAAIDMAMEMHQQAQQEKTD